jgi:Right handed beta helix region
MNSPLTRKIRALGSSLRRSVSADRRVVAAAKSVLTETLESRMMLSTYYVSTSGSDSNSGTSPTSAWKTVGKANSANLDPGDTLLFQGGQTFNGNLSISSGDSGSSSNPVTIGSYGSGRATINAGNGRGIYALDSQYLNIDNLIIVGSGPTKNATIGIKIDSNLSNSTLNNININNVDVSGFGTYGIEIITEKSGGWYNNVQITNSAVHNNMMAGIYTLSASQYGVKNLYIGQTSAYGNPGDGNWGSGVSGSGINLNGVDGGVVEYCTAYGNGSNGTGGCGIWSSSSNDLLFQYNDAYSNITRGNRDGDGFDFDHAVQLCVQQFWQRVHVLQLGQQYADLRRCDSVQRL